MSGIRFTLMAFSAGDGWPVIETVRTREPKAVVQAAEDILAAKSHERVEIWHEGQQLHTVRDERDAA